MTSYIIRMQFVSVAVFTKIPSDGTEFISPFLNISTNQNILKT